MYGLRARRHPPASASGHVTGTPPRSLHARGAGALGDTSGRTVGWHNALRAARSPAAGSGAARRRADGDVRRVVRNITEWGK